jgi:hypothetical protein
MEIITSLAIIILLVPVVITSLFSLVILYSIHVNMGGNSVKFIDRIVTKPVESYNQFTPQEHEKTVPIEDFEPDTKRPLKVKIIDDEENGFTGLEES